MMGLAAIVSPPLYTNVFALAVEAKNSAPGLPILGAPFFVAAFWVSAKASPFCGFVSEIPLVLLATLACSGPVTVLHMANEDLKQKREALKAAGHAVEFRGQAPTRAVGITPLGILFFVLF